MRGPVHGELWAQFLPPGFAFERRSAHPPHNAVNACISFGATLVYHELISALQAHGLDAALGHLHATENGRCSLALDLMEVFRPCFIEALTMHLFSHRLLGTQDFAPQNGGIYLTPEGRQTFFIQYEQRVQRPFYSEHTGRQTTLDSA